MLWVFACFKVLWWWLVLFGRRCHSGDLSLDLHVHETAAVPAYTLGNFRTFSLQNTLPQACSTAARSVLTNRDCCADAKRYDCNEGCCQGTRPCHGCYEPRSGAWQSARYTLAFTYTSSLVSIFTCSSSRAIFVQLHICHLPESCFAVLWLTFGRTTTMATTHRHYYLR